MREMLFNPPCYCRSVHGVKVLDCCADWMRVLQISASEMLAGVSNQVYNMRAVPAGKCRRRMAYGRRFSQAFASPVLIVIMLPFYLVSSVQNRDNSIRGG